MRTFRFRTIASGSFLIIMFGLLLIPVLMIKEYFGPIEVGEPLGLSIIAIYMISVYHLAVILSKGIIEVKFNRDKIDFKWLKKPLTFQASCTISLNDIESWRNRSIQHFELFKIYLKNEQSVELRRMNYWNQEKDEYGAFLKSFKALIEDENLTREKSLDNENTKVPAMIMDKEVAFYKSYKGNLALALWVFTLVWAVMVIAQKGGAYKGSQMGFIIAGILGLVSLIFTYFSRNN